MLELNQPINTRDYDANKLTYLLSSGMTLYCGPHTIYYSNNKVYYYETEIDKDRFEHHYLLQLEKHCKGNTYNWSLDCTIATLPTLPLYRRLL